MKKIILMVVVLTAVALIGHADFYIKQITESGMAGTQTTETWIGKKQMASVMKDQSFIIDTAAKKMFVINHKDKTYVEADLPLDVSKLIDPQAAQMMKGMLDGMTVSVKDTGNTKEIDQWKCTEYKVTMGMMGMEFTMTFWNTTDVKFDWKQVAQMQGELMKIQQAGFGGKLADEFQKIKGFNIAMEMDAMGQKVKSKVQEISEKDAPAGAYSVPKGYTKTDKLKTGGMTR